MEEVNRVRMMMAVSAAVLVAAGLFIIAVEGLNVWSAVVFATVVAIASVALLLVTRALRDMKSGFPLQDERSKALNAKAGYYAFYLSMYLTLAIGALFVLLEDRDMTLPNSELLFIIVAMMGSIHIAFSLYVNRKRRRSHA